MRTHGAHPERSQRALTVLYAGSSRTSAWTEPPRARRCGLLLADTGTADIADAAVALLVQDGDTVLTSDPGEIKRLLEATGTRARIRTV